jgi:hypothetical protein
MNEYMGGLLVGAMVAIVVQLWCFRRMGWL